MTDILQDVIGSLGEELRNANKRIDQLERENAELLRAADVAVTELMAARRENAALEKRLQAIQRMCLGYQAEHAGLRKDAERWKFTMWWQDKNPKPTHIQDELTNMHRWARQRGALAPNADELQRATDAAIDAAMKEQT